MSSLQSLADQQWTPMIRVEETPNSNKWSAVAYSYCLCTWIFTFQNIGGIM